MVDRKLYKIHFPSKKNELSPFLFYVGKPLSYPLFWLLIKTPMTAHQATGIMMFFGIFGALLYLPGQYSLAVLGAIFLQIAVLFDVVDGSIARYRGASEHDKFMGKYFDTLFHDIVVPLFFICVGFYLFNQTGIIWYVYGGIFLFFWIVSTNLLRLTKYFVLDYYKKQKEYEMKAYAFKEIAQKNVLMKALSEVLRNLSAFDQMYLFFLIATVFHLTQYLFVAYLIFYLPILPLKILIELKSGFYGMTKIKKSGKS